MALITKAIKGTKDVLPKEAYKNQYIEATAIDIASKFGYKEILFLSTLSFSSVASVTLRMWFKRKCTHLTIRAAGQ